MSGQDDDSDKSFDATPEKLLKARRKGEIPRSTDLLTAASYFGLLVALVSVGTNSIERLGTLFLSMLANAGEVSERLMQGSDLAAAGMILNGIALGLAPVLIIPAIFVLSTLFAKQAIVFAPEKLKPRISRISIVSNAKNKFGRSGLFEFAKSFSKLCIYSLCLAWFVRRNASDMIAIIQAEGITVINLLGRLFLSFLFLVTIVAAVIGVVDAIWQHHEHLRKNRMSRKEIMDETKDAEGDPHLKQERRQRALAAAQTKMMQDVPGADVVVVNPTHFAVALKWSRLPGEAPICVAKGVDELAARIREIAQESGVPIHSDPPTARALHATTEIGHEISPDHYGAVAAAIRFAEAMRLKMKGRG